jgi:uncharacterized membrane protein
MLDMVAEWIGAVGLGIEIFGVLVIVGGIVYATYGFGRARGTEINDRFRHYKIRLGQSLLLGLEVLVAADIVRTVALEPNFTNLGVLGLLVLIRTFLSWTLELEVEGRWPWNIDRPQGKSADADPSG